MQTQVISKLSGKKVVSTESLNIKIPDSSIVLIDVSPEDVQEIIVDDNQVVIKLKNGESLTIENFTSEVSDLVFRANDKELFLLDFAQVEYNPIASVDSLLSIESSSLLTLNSWKAGGLAIAGIGVVAALASGGGGSGSSTPTETEVNKNNLSNAITDANAELAELDGNQNTIVSDAINQAKLVFGNANATQQEIDNATNLLNQILKDAKNEEDLEDAAQLRLEAIVAASKADLANNVFDGQEKTDVENAISAAEAIITDANSSTENLLVAIEALNKILGDSKANEALEDVAQKQLEDSIAAAQEDLSNNVFDGQEKTDVEEAIKQVELILNNPDSSSNEFVAAKNYLEKVIIDAKQAEDAESVADSLEDSIADAQSDVDSGDFDGVELDTVKKAIEDAKVVLNNQESTPEQIESATVELNKALSDAQAAEVLENAAQKELEEAVDAAQQDLSNGEFDGVEKTSVEQAITIAENLINNPNSSKQDLNQGTIDLNQAVTNAKAAEALENVAQKQLEDSITTAQEDLENNIFDGQEKTNVEQAINQVENVLNNPDSSVEDFEAAKVNLDKVVFDAKQAEEQETVKDSLADSIADAQSDVDSGIFDGAELDAAKKAIEDAEVVFVNQESTPEQIELASSELKNALSEAKAAEVLENSAQKGLEDAIITAKQELSNDVYDGSEKTAVEQAITAAENLIKDPNSSKQDFDQETSDFNQVVTKAKADEAIENVAQQGLESAIAVAKSELEKGSFDGQEKIEVEAAIKLAETILNNPESTAEDFNTAVITLNKSVEDAQAAELAESVKESLAEAIVDVREDISSGIFDGDELKIVQEAIQEAEAVLNDPLSADQDFKNAEDELKKIVAEAKAAEELDSAKDSLEDSISDAMNDVDSGIFDGEELKNVEEAIKAADDVLNNSESTNEDYQKAEDDLDKIVADAKAAEAVETEQESLADSIEDAKAVADSEKVNGEELKYLQDAIAVAEGVLNDPSSTNQNYQSAEVILDQAVAYAKASELLSIDTLNPTSDNTPTISGSALKDSFVTLKLEANGDTQTLTVRADANGQWQITADTLVDGEYTVTAYVSDVNGTLIGPLEQNTNLIIDTTLSTSLQAELEIDSGKLGDGITNNGKVLVSKVEPNSVWSYSLDAGKTWLLGTGDHFVLAEGSYDNVLVKQVDIAGNTELISLGKIVIDRTQPILETFEISENNSIISGKAEIGAEITISQKLGEVTTVLGTATVNGSGEYSFLLNPIPKNGEILTAVAKDAAGNESAVISISTPVLSEQLINLADNSTVLIPNITPTVSKPTGDDVLANKTGFAVASVGLGPVLSADVLTDVLSNSLEIKVGEDNIRNVTLKSQAGGISIASMYDLMVYRKDESSGEFKLYKQELQWLKAYLLAGVSDKLTLSLPQGDYLVFLTPSVGVTVLSGYTLKVLNDDILDFSTALSVEGSTTGNVITDVDKVNGVDLVPTGTVLDSITFEGTTTQIGSNETQVKGQFGTLYVNQDGSYRYEIDSNFKGPFGQTENFVYTVKYGNETQSAKLDILVSNKAPEPLEIKITDTIIVEPQPIIKTHPKPIDQLTNIKVLDVSFLDPILKADAVDISNFMKFRVDENTVRELLLQGDGGGVSLTTYSLYIYREDEVTKQFVQYHVEKNWYTVIFGGKSAELPLKFTEGNYIATVVPTGLNVLGGASLYVNEDTLFDYNLPVNTSVTGTSNGDVTLDPTDTMLTIDNQQFNGSSLKIDGQYGVLNINTDGTYNYVLNPINTAGETPYGKIESFTYVVLNKDGSTRLDTLNIKIDLASLNDDANVNVVNLNNMTDIVVDEATLNIGTGKRELNATFDVQENVVSTVSISFESTLSLNTTRNVSYKVLNSKGQEVASGTLNRVTGKELVLKDLPAGKYTLESTLINPNFGYFSDSTITFQNTYLNAYQANGVVSVTGDVSSNDSGTASISSYTINGLTTSAFAGNKQITVEGKYGNLVFNSDGTYSYTPSGKGFGIETFEYTAETIVGTNSSANLIIQVPKNVTGSLFNDVVESSAANDSFTMGTGVDTLIFNVLDQLSATGGNGVDTWSDFNVGTNSDVIDVSALLADQNITDISNYISVSVKDNNTIISIDRDGKSYETDGLTVKKDQFETAELLILNNNNLSLDDLLKNNQLLF